MMASPFSKKRIVAVFILMILSFIATASSTYAFFSLTTSNQVDNVQMSIRGESQTELSLDGTNWYSSLPSALIESAGGAVSLNPLTSQDGKTFYDLSGAKGSKSQYFTFTLQLRTTEASATDVWLVDNLSDGATPLSIASLDGTVVTSAPTSWVNGYGYYYDATTWREAGTDALYYASDAVRISIEGSGSMRIFDLSPSAATRGFGTTYGANDYYKHYFGLETLDIPSAPETVTTLSRHDEHFLIFHDDASLVASLGEIQADGFAYTEMTIRVWIEGWDADCLNAIIEQNVSLKLKFCVGTYVPS